jgi:hypothetical protein
MQADQQGREKIVKIPIVNHIGHCLSLLSYNGNGKEDVASTKNGE